MSKKMLFTLPVFVSLLIVMGCGNSQEGAPWPGHIRTINGFTESETIKILEAIRSLNEKSGENLILENEKESNFSIEISKVSGSSWPKSQAGFATVKPSDCKIEISADLFESTKSDYLHPVLWHEIGHCAGLGHSSSENEIMSAATLKLSAYPSQTIHKFIQSIRNSAGI